MGSTQYRSGHTQREPNLHSGIERLSKLEKHPAGRDVAGQSGQFLVANGKHCRKRQGKPDCATNLVLPRSAGSFNMHCGVCGGVR